MKITRRQLRQIIKEEVELSDSDKIRIVHDAKTTLDRIGGVHKDARHFASLMRRSAYDAMRASSDDEAQTSAGASMRGGGQGAGAIPVEAILDALSDAGIVELDTSGRENGIVDSNLIKKEQGSSQRVSESTVKITRKQLRQMIIEQYESLEQDAEGESSAIRTYDTAFVEALDAQDYMITQIFDEATSSALRGGTNEEKLIQLIEMWMQRARNSIRRSFSVANNMIDDSQKEELKVFALKQFIEKIRSYGGQQVQVNANRVQNAQTTRDLAKIIRHMFVDSRMGLTGPLDPDEGVRLQRKILSTLREA